LGDTTELERVGPLHVRPATPFLCCVTAYAAATAVVGVPPPRAVERVDPLEFCADHAFLFFLRDTKTGSLLFMGRVVDPSAG